jgi:hypothetical protein
MNSRVDALAALIVPAAVAVPSVIAKTNAQFHVPTMFKAYRFRR